MEYMPEFIHASYNGEGKKDYALKAGIAMEGVKEHPQDAEYIYAYACSFLNISKQHKECVAQGFKYLPLITKWECRVHTMDVLVEN